MRYCKNYVEKFPGQILLPLTITITNICIMIHVLVNISKYFK